MKIEKRALVDRWTKKSLAKSKKLYKNTLAKDSRPCSRHKYVQYNHVLQKLKRNAKRQYYFSKCVEFRSNTKKLWQTINQICKRQNDKTSIVQCLKIDNIRSCNTQVIANKFGEFFLSVGKTNAGKIPTSNKNIDAYLDRIQSATGSIYMTPATLAETKN